MTQDKERIQEMENQLQELSKQLAEIKQVQALSFAKGWYYVESKLYKYLALNPSIEGCEVIANLQIVLSDNYNVPEKWWVCSVLNIKSHRPATPEEIKNALTEVCKRKGIVPGATVKCLYEGALYKVKTNDWTFKENHSTHGCTLWASEPGDGGPMVYNNGQFAEVVKEPEEKITIGGYEVKFFNKSTNQHPDNYHTEIEGNIFPKEFWQSAKVVAENTKAAVIVGCSAKDKGAHSWVADLQTINKILKRLEK